MLTGCGLHGDSLVSVIFFLTGQFDIAGCFEMKLYDPPMNMIQVIKSASEYDPSNRELMLTHITRASLVFDYGNIRYASR